MTFLVERCDKCIDMIHKLLAFPTIILQLVNWVLKRTYTSHKRTERSHFAPEGCAEESWNSQAVSSYHDNGYRRIIDIPLACARSSASASRLLTLVPQVRGSNTAIGKLASAISQPSLCRSITRPTTEYLLRRCTIRVL